ncbi:ABC transporter permease [Clostridium estertheticum]|uniref:ABC transporter permease n=1 Tax=Clostridium estertheticum TaxID=238834 RepID=UPI0013EEAC53|nr:ABC transporter permease [Clostridium estertheticum]MBZ9607029.1 ABC transporter permease [Clostridium estertheticum]
MTKFKKEEFELIDCEQQNADMITRPNITYWQDAWRRLKKNPIAMISLVILIVLILMVIFGPYINGKDFKTVNGSKKNISPCSEYWFGTDALGRDLFARIWYGGRVSIAIGLIATGIQIIVGCLYGGVMAYFGGWIDEVMMRIIEVLTSIPSLLLTILIMVVLGNSITTLIIALTITSWCGTSRMIRGQLMQLRENEYILAAEALGASPVRVIIKHLIPNTIGVLILTIATSIPGYIFAEAGLSFLGLGLQAPNTSWGVLISYGQSAMAFYPYQLFFPTFAICLTVLAFNLFGDGLRDALDPKLRQ